MSVKEQKELKEPQSRDDIAITDADKGSAVVILDVEDYIEEAKRQLQNTENYKRLNQNPTTTNKETVNKNHQRLSLNNYPKRAVAIKVITTFSALILTY